MKLITGAKAQWKVASGVMRQGRYPEKIQSEIRARIVAMIRLAAEIHAETDPIIQKEIEAWDSLNNKNFDDQDCVFDLKKYQNGIRTFRPGKLEGDLTSANEELTGAMFQSGMSKAESEHRAQADMTALKD